MLEKKDALRAQGCQVQLIQVTAKHRYNHKITNLKRTPSSLSPSIFYVVKKLAIKR